MCAMLLVSLLRNFLYLLTPMVIYLSQWILMLEHVRHAAGQSA
jgi:hypothetical protein